MQKKICKSLLLFGGGIDSSALSNYLKAENIDHDLLIINYNQKSYFGEFHAAHYFGKLNRSNVITRSLKSYQGVQHPLLNGSMANEHNENVLILRNQLFLNEAVIYAFYNGYSRIYIGIHQEPQESQFYDAMSPFIEGYQKLLDIQQINIEICMPFNEMNKKEYIKYLSFEDIENTFSCYESSGIRECGKCTHCIQKKDFINELKKESE